MTEYPLEALPLSAFLNVTIILPEETRSLLKKQQHVKNKRSFLNIVHNTVAFFMTIWYNLAIRFENEKGQFELSKRGEST